MLEKDLDKWFEENREVGEIDDFIRQSPNFSWKKLSYDEKIKFYMTATGRTVEKKQLKLNTRFPDIVRVVSVVRKESLEGELISEYKNYKIDGNGTAQILESMVEYGNLAPLPYISNLKHDTPEGEYLEWLFHDFFSRLKWLGRGNPENKQNRQKWWNASKNMDLNALRGLMYRKLVIFYKDRKQCIEWLDKDYNEERYRDVHLNEWEKALKEAEERGLFKESLS